MNMKKGMLALISLITLALCLPLQACQPALGNEFEVTSLDVTPAKVIVNEKFTVIADIGNAGKSEMSYVIPVMVNGIADDRTTLKLAPGKSWEIQFTLSRSKPGAYEIRVGNKSSSIQVIEALPPVLKLSGLKLNMEVANPGEEVVVTALLSNTGGSKGDYVAEMKINGTAEQSEKLILPPGVNYNLAFRIIKNEPGTYSVSIGDLAGKFIVQEPIQTIQMTAPICPPQKAGTQRSACCP
jgi:hypothetical protein